MHRMIVKLCQLAALIVVVLVPVVAAAEPTRIIILRHGEKRDPYRLCDVESGALRHWPTITSAAAPRIHCFPLKRRRTRSSLLLCIRWNWPHQQL